MLSVLTTTHLSDHVQDHMTSRLHQPQKVGAFALRPPWASRRIGGSRSIPTAHRCPQGEAVGSPKHLQTTVQTICDQAPNNEFHDARSKAAESNIAIFMLSHSSCHMLHVAPIKDVSVNKSMTFSPLFFARDRISKPPYIAIALQTTLLASIHMREKLRNAEAHIISLDLSFNFSEESLNITENGC